MDNSLTNFVIGVLSSLVASAFLYLGVLRPIKEKIGHQIDVAINPVEEFRDITELLSMLKRTISSYESDYSRLLLFRALPCELTDSLAHHMYPNLPLEIRHALLEYQTMVQRIIAEGHDKSILGKTGTTSLDKETHNAILRQYLLGRTPPDATELGLHDNLNEVGVLLLGTTETTTSPQLNQWKYGFLIIFSWDFKQCRGFMYKDHNHIDNLRLIFDQKEKDSAAKQLLCMMSSDMKINDFTSFASRGESFYQ